MSYAVAVRALCEFTARTGDLDLRFTPSPTALEGIAGHQAVTARRGSGYERELLLEGHWGPLRVRGRADGFDVPRNRLEEIKTHRGDLARQPANHRALHWAQAKVYGWLLCQSRGIDRLRIALVYYDIGSQRETVIEEEHEAAALQAFFEDQCARFLAWAEQEMSHRAARDAALAGLSFPHPAFRPGQRELAAAVWRTATQGRCLQAQAPTGIGKTVGTVFPLLKACGGGGIDKVFFLAAKTPGRQLALEAFERVAQAAPALPLRLLELTARDKACEHPDKACHPDSCPLARGFYDRLPAARAEALQLTTAMHGAPLRELALRHAVCPYYLTQELARWADAVVGDYHYYFDTSALLHALTQAQEWRVGVLVDEAHNLVERGRSMYTAEMDPEAFRAVRRGAPKALKRPLDRLARAWRALSADMDEPFVTRAELPQEWLQALQQAAAAVADHLAEAPHEPGGELQQFYFDALAFGRLADSFGEHSMFDLTLRPAVRGSAWAVPCIRNLIPGPFLGPRWRDAHTATLFSATLQPDDYYRNTLGLPEDTASIDVPPPFRTEQLDVRLVRHISTRWSDRQRSVQPIAELIARQYGEAPGNYLAFFSSFDYLRSVAAAVQSIAPGIPVWEQTPGMAELRRRDFLARFVPGGAGIGFAVLGGSFGEGIDLPGDRLVGAFIATLGLPQVNAVNEELRTRLQRRFGAGWDYAYLYPGLRKVVQAAGRVIRTSEDRGVIYLIDYRFTRAEVRQLLPAWWTVRMAGAEPASRPG